MHTKHRAHLPYISIGFGALTPRLSLCRMMSLPLGKAIAKDGGRITSGGAHGAAVHVHKLHARFPRATVVLTRHAL